MWGKIIVSSILAAAVVAGVSMYYLQVYAYYDEVSADGAGGVTLVSAALGTVEPVAFDDYRAIDADSSPIRFRACFSLPMSQAALSETYVSYDAAEPLTAPSWFDCFDADAIGDALEDGTALPFLGAKNIAYGVDRVVAVLPDGRAFAWHQLNDCGEKAYDGTPVGEECPARADFQDN